MTFLVTQTVVVKEGAAADVFRAVVEVVKTVFQVMEPDVKVLVRVTFLVTYELGLMVW